MKNNKKKRGFTIIELVIVIAVIAILAGVLIPTFSSVIEKANKSARLQTARDALIAVLADQSDGALDGAIFEIKAGSDNYYYTYKNGTLSQNESATAPTDVTGVSTSGDSIYKVVFSDAAADNTTTSPYTRTIVESTLKGNVTVYISSTDFEQAGK